MSKRTKAIRPAGVITQDMEKLLFELTCDHELQAHEILGMVYNWIRVHSPGAIEVYEDGSNPVFFYGKTLDN